MKARIKESNPVLRQHQTDALRAMGKTIRKGGGKGRIVLPTGTGKTRIEAETVFRLSNIRKKGGQWPGVYVVLSPRILLAYQQLDEFLIFIAREGVDCEYMTVNSGGINSIEYEKKLLKLGFDNPNEIASTTSVDAIVGKIKLAQSRDVPLVIFSTYHSVERVKEAAKHVDLDVQSYIFDEAQYCVTSGEFQNVPDYPALFKFFFTATEKWTDSDSGLGMNNEDKFGDLVFTEKPKVLIERGEMASVAIHLVGTRGQDIADDDYESLAKAMLEAFDKHRAVMKEHSFAPDTIGPKMIVVCDKQDSLRGIMKSKALKAYKLVNQQVNLCALSSDFGIEVNGEYTPRANNKNKEALLAKMRNWGLQDEAIVLHVDMIAEGLNVPGMTAVMPFRSLGKIKFLQNLGRGTRLVDDDRRRLYRGEIKPKDWKNYTKPFCWLVLPVLSTEYYDMKRRYTEYIYALRSEYGFDSKELIVVDNLVGPPEPDPLDDLVGGVGRKFDTGKGLIEEIMHSIEDGEIMSEFMDNVFKFNTYSPEKQIRILREIYAPDLKSIGVVAFRKKD
jgi:superfamily II DNA or RNA helicase